MNKVTPFSGRLFAWLSPVWLSPAWLSPNAWLSPKWLLQLGLGLMLLAAAAPSEARSATIFVWPVGGASVNELNLYFNIDEPVTMTLPRGDHGRNFPVARNHPFTGIDLEALGLTYTPSTRVLRGEPKVLGVGRFPPSGGSRIDNPNFSGTLETTLATESQSANHLNFSHQNDRAQVDKSITVRITICKSGANNAGDLDDDDNVINRTIGATECDAEDYEALSLGFPERRAPLRAADFPDFQLPEAAGGYGDVDERILNYTFAFANGTHSQGPFTYDPATRTISLTGANTGDEATYEADYSVEDFRSGATVAGKINILVTNARGVANPGGQVFARGETVDLTLGPLLPTISNVQYDVADVADVPNLSFDSSSSRRVLSGFISAAVGNYTLTYTAVDGTNNAQGNPRFTAEPQEFPVRVVKTLFRFVADIADQTYDFNTAITPLTLPLAEDNIGAITYDLEGSLPDGLVFSGGVLSGTLSTAALAANYPLTYTATDGGNNDFKISIPFNFRVNRVFVEQNVVLTFEAGRTYTSNSPLPNQILPDAFLGGGTQRADILGVRLEGNLPQNLNTSRTTLGGSKVSAVIIGTAMEAGSFGDGILHTLLFTDGINLTRSYRIVITGPSFDAGALPTSPLTYLTNAPIGDIEMPVGTGHSGSLPLTYLLSGPAQSGSTDGLPPGLSFSGGSSNDVTRILSGTPTSPGTYPLTYTVRDKFFGTYAGNQQTGRFTIVVSNAIFDAAAPQTQSFIVGRAITELTLPTAIPASNNFDYTLTGRHATIANVGGAALPAGLNFNTGERVFNGMVQDAGSYTFTYTATESGAGTPDAVSLTFQANAITALTYNGAVDDVTAAVGADVAHSLPSASFADPADDGMPIDYLVYGPGGTFTNNANLPPGLSFDRATSSLRGQAQKVGDTQITYSATSTPGNAEAIFTLTVDGGPAFFGGQSIGDVDYPVGVTIAAADVLVLPEAVTAFSTADRPRSYHLNGANPTTGDDGSMDLDLPDGLVFDAAARTLGGAPTTAAAAVMLTYSVQDGFANESAGLTFAATITGPAFDLDANPAPGGQTYVSGTTIAPLVLPQAAIIGVGGPTSTPASYTLFGPGGTAATPNLPGGLVFNETAGGGNAARTLTGTPNAVTEATTTELVYTATPTSGGGVTALTFSVTINPALAVAALPDLTFPAGLAITPPQILPLPTGGITPYTYILFQSGKNPGQPEDYDDLTVAQIAVLTPAGIAFERDTRGLSGTPTTAGTFPLIYRVHDSSPGSNNARRLNPEPNFTMVITGPIFAGALPIAAQTYYLDTAITDDADAKPLTLPTASTSSDGLADVPYTLTGPGGQALNMAVPGLVFDTTGDAPVLRGTPTTLTGANPVSLTYTATDDLGNATTAIFAVHILRNFLDSIPDLTAVISDDFSYIFPGAGGGGTRTYILTRNATGTVDANLPIGLELNRGNSTSSSSTIARTLSGVVEGLDASGDTGGTVQMYYRVNPATPANLNDSRTAEFSFTVEAAEFIETPPTNIGYSLNVTLDNSTSTTLPAVNASEVSYTLRGANATVGDDNLPSGLAFDTDSRVISGMPDMTGNFPLTYTADLSFGADLTGDIVVSVTSVTYTATVADLSFDVGDVVNNTTLPTAVDDGDSTATLTYALYGPGTTVDIGDSNAVNAANGLNLPGGFTFDNTAGALTLSGTAQQVGTTRLTYAAAGTTGTAIATFDFTVGGGPAFAAGDLPIGDESYVTGLDITAKTLPLATGFGVNTALTYSLTGANPIINADGDITDRDLPAGLVFTTTATATGTTLSGAPTGAPAAVNLTYTATDEFGNVSANAIFAVTITGPVFDGATIADKTYSLNIDIGAAEVLPTARGVDVSYTLTGAGGGALPGGLAFNATDATDAATDAARTLSGMPTTISADTPLTYTATDGDSNETALTFTVTVTGPTFVDAAPGAQMYTAGRAIPTLTLSEASTTTNASLLVHVLTGKNATAGNLDLPAGLIFTGGTAPRTLSGTPQAVNASTPVTLTYTATILISGANGFRNGGFAQQFFDVTINPGLAFPANSNPGRTYAAGVSLADLAADMRTLTAATGGTGSISYALFAEGGSPTDARLPAALGFNATTRTLTGMATAAGTTTMTYRATDAATPPNITDAVFTITIAGPSFVGDLPAARTYFADIAITNDADAKPLTLPTASTESANVSYTLTGPNAQALNIAVPGLVFDTTGDAPVLRGEPTTLTGATPVSLTYTATDAHGNAITEIFAMHIRRAFLQDIPDFTVVRSSEFSHTFPGASGGGARTYILTGSESGTVNANIPSGLTFNPTNDSNPATSAARTLSGVLRGLGTTPPIGSIQMYYRVNPSNADDSLTAEFSFTVLAADFIEDPPANIGYPLDVTLTASTQTTLPAVTATEVSYSLTGANASGGNDDLPSGLAFDTDSRVISGRPDMADTFPLTYIADLSFGPDLTHEFDLSVTSITYTADVIDASFDVGDTVSHSLPTAVDDGNPDATITYALYGPGTTVDIGDSDAVNAANGMNLPGDFTFDNTAGALTLSGTAQQVGTTSLTYAAAGPNGTVTATFDFTVSGGPAFASGYTIAAASYVTGVSITDLVLDAAASGFGGVQNLTYELSGATADDALPAGLSFGGANATAAARTLSGTPTGAPDATAVNLVYTATDRFGNVSAAVAFAITITGPAFASTPGDQTFTSSNEITPIVLPSASGAGISYALTGANGGALPDGLVFSAATRTLSGTPTSGGDAVSFTYTATDNASPANVARANFMVTIEGPEFDLATTPAPGAQIYLAGEDITALALPAATIVGTGAAAVYTLTAVGGLPAGLDFNATASGGNAARTLTGNPNQVTASTTTALVYTATSGSATTALTFDVTINPALAVAALPDLTFPAGLAITPPQILPLPTGGITPYTYILFESGKNPGQPENYDDLTAAEITALTPAGIAFERGSRSITGTPETAGTYMLIYRVHDSSPGNNSDKRLSPEPSFNIVVTGPSLPSLTLAPIYTADVEIDAVVLPQATSSATPVSYSMSGLPAGLEFNAGGATDFTTDAARTLSGTPTTATGPGGVTVTYTATDVHDNETSLEFTVTVNRVFSATIADQTFTVGVNVAGQIVLPTANGGGTLVYSLLGPNGTASDRQLPAGLIYTAGTPPVLSGTLQTAEAVTLTYSATNSADSADSIEQTFAFVVEQIVFDDADEPLTTINYPLNVPITEPITLPAANGSGIVYTLVPNTSLDSSAVFPPGLSFNPIDDATGAAARTITGTPTEVGDYPLIYTATAATGSFGGPIRRDLTVFVTRFDFDRTDLGLSFNAGDTVVDSAAGSTGVSLPAAVDDANTGATIVYALYGPGTTADISDRDSADAVNNMNLPAGLMFDNAAGTLMLSGQARQVGTTAFTYAATNADSGLSITEIFDFTVGGGPAFAANNLPIDAESYVTGLDISAKILPLADGFGDNTAFTYILTGANPTMDTDGNITDRDLPAGLTFNATNVTTGDAARTLSGTPTGAPATAVNLTYTATDTFGNVSGEVIFSVTITGPSFDDATIANKAYFLGVDIGAAEVLPTARGVDVSYTLTGAGGGALPGGLAFNATDATDAATDAARTLSGMPTTISADTQLTYTATDSADNATMLTFTVTVTGPTFAGPAVVAQTYAVGFAVDVTLPAATTSSANTDPVTYTLTGNGTGADGLPAGITFNPALVAGDTFIVARSITGTPVAAAVGGYSLTYTATDGDGGLAQQVFDVTVNARFEFESVPPRIEFPAGATVNHDLPEGIGGIPPYRYLLTTSGLTADPQLPSWFTSGSNDRTITGMPTIAAETEINYTVFDAAAQSRDGDFTLVITGPIFAAGDLPITVPTLAAGTAITDVVLPLATSSAPSLTHTLTGANPTVDLDGNITRDTDGTPTNADLPAGLMFNATSRTLSGNPDVAGAFMLTYTARDEYGNETSLEFTVTVNRAFVGDALAELTLIVGDDVATAMPDAFPLATGGGTLAYTLADSSITDNNGLPVGLTFNPTADAGATPPIIARTLTGIAQTPIDSTLTYTATNVADPTDFIPQTFDLVVENIAFATQPPENLNYPFNVLIDAAAATPLPAVIRGSNVVYSLVAAAGSTFPPGLSFNPTADANTGAAARTITGTPTMEGTHSLIYTATDDFGNTATAMIEVSIATITFEVPVVDLSFNVGDVVDEELSAAADGDGSAGIYALYGPGTTVDPDNLGAANNSNLPVDLSFANAAGERILSGTPELVGETLLTYAASGSGGTITVNFRLTIGGGPAFAENLTIEPESYVTGLDISAKILPLADGFDNNTPLAYMLTGANPTMDADGNITDADLPAGLIFNATDATIGDAARTLSGSPTGAPAAAVMLTYTASDEFGNVSDGVMFAVTITGPVFDGATIADKTYFLGVDIAAAGAQILPVALGNNVSYALSAAAGAVPGWLTLNAGNAAADTVAARTLTGTPTAVAAAVELIYTATDGDGNAISANFMVTITGPTFADAAPGAQMYTAGLPITAETLSEASTTTAAASVVYTLTGANPVAANNGLPAGLIFNATANSGAAARTLTGTPQAVDASTTVTLTYTATDANGGGVRIGGFAQQFFDVTINPGLAFAADAIAARMEYPAGRVVSQTLPLATGGAGDLSYDLFSEGNSPADPQLLSWMNFTPGGSRNLTGTPELTAEISLIYRATDSDNTDNMTELSFTAVVTGPSFAAGDLPLDNQPEYIADIAIDDVVLPAATSSTASLTYTLIGANPTRETDGTITNADLPAGLEFDVAVGVRTLSGIPTIAGTYTLTYFATDNYGNTTPDATFDVTIGRVFAVDPLANITITVGTDVAAIVTEAFPTANGGGSLNYALFGPGDNRTNGANLPTGLSFDADRLLVGTAQSVGNTELTYAATNAAEAADFIQQTFNFVVEDITFDLTPPMALDYSLNVAITEPITLPAASGSGILYDLVAAPGSTFPLGLTFNPTASDTSVAARTITGTPTAAGDYELRYTATPGSGGFGTALSHNIDLSVTSLTFTADLDAISRDIGAAVNQQLPAAADATNSSDGITYALYGPAPDGAAVDTTNGANLPQGLSFDNAADARMLTGAAEIIGDTSLTYAATRAAGAGGGGVTGTFMFSVLGERPAFAADVDIGDKSYVTGIDIDTGLAAGANILPAATAGFGGVNSLTYTLRGQNATETNDDLPDGLIFNATDATTGAAARTLSGSPTGAPAAAVMLTYTASDEFGNVSDGVMFAVTITGPVFDVSIVDETYPLNIAITAKILPVATGAGVVYTVTGALPAGLTFNPTANTATGAAARTITGTPTMPAAAVMLVYTATDGAGNATTDDFMVTITGPTFAADAPTGLAYTAGQSVTLVLSDATTNGTTPVTFTLTGDGTGTNGLPNGLTFNPTANSGAAARTLTGTPDAVDASTVYSLTYTATDAATGTAPNIIPGGFSDQTFSVTIDPGLAFPENSNPDRIYAAGVNLASLAADMRTLTAATGGTGTISYALFAEGGSPTDARLPAGLNFNTAADSRAISGTPTTAAASTEMTYRATDAATPPTSTDAVFTITITGPIFAADALADALPGEAGEAVTFPVGEAITDLVLPAASSSAAPVTYTLTGADLPAGLEFDAAVDVRTLSGTPTVAANAVTLTYKAIDNYGNQTMAGTFKLTIEQVLDGEVVEMFDRVFPIGIAVDITLPPVRSDGYVYTLTSAAFPPGLAFNARTLTGQPTTSGSYLLTYTATPPAGGAATVALSYEFTFAVVDMAFVETEQTYNFAVDDVVDMTLPEVVGGFRPVTYALTAGGVVVDGSLAAEIAADLSFDPDTRVLTGTLDSAIPDLSLLYTATDSASNPGPNTATANITISVANTDMDAVNQIILPEVAHAISDSVAAAITTRIEHANSGGGGGAGLAIGGQSGIAGLLATHGQPMARQELDAKTLLTGTTFTVPLNGGGNGIGNGSGGLALADGGAGAAVNSATIWGSGEYREMSGTSGDLDWDGELRGFHLGLDARLRPGLLAGLSVARLQSEIDYRDLGGGLGAGTHDIDMTSLHPYLGWRSGNADFWATLGYGQGDLDITPAGGAKTSADLDLRAAGFGGSGHLWRNDVTALLVRGDVAYNELEVPDNAAFAASPSATTRLRLAVEASHRFALSSGGALTPLFEAGLRHSGGDGETGLGAEVGLGLRYHSPTTRLAADGRLHLVTSPGDYEEWGFQGSLALQPGADGQGLSLTLAPTYGAAATGIAQLWRRGLPETAADRDHRVRIKARLGYGVTLKNHSGVLTPYGEFTLGDTASYRLGIDWKTGSQFDLNLLGERRENTDNAAEHSILMRGQVEF